MGDTTREKWDTEKMREHRNDWSLAADIHLFSYMQQFSQNLLGETHSTLKALDSLESDVATTFVEVSNIGNRFWALSDTQFVENRVYDDDDVTSPVAPTSPQDNQTEDNETVVIQRLREAIQNGIQVLDSKFETVQVPASDSDEDDSSPHSGVILKPVNRYKDRRLPHLIGSPEFRTDDTLGLRDAPSDEEMDDFMSASDKANESASMGESEDSDIESDQTKTQHILSQKQNNIFDPHNLRLPGLENVQANSNAPSPPSGDMFGEEGDDLFSQMAHKKPVFSSWQPSDLWAPEKEDEKRLVDDSSNNRPPSANSSISSAQSSNVSEPIKKTSEDFGKSGTGRQAVLVQEDQDDLFGSKAVTSAIPPHAKEFVPAGGVKIFGGDFNPFSNRNPLNENQNEDSSPVMDNNRPEKDDVEDNIFAKKHNMPTKVLPKVPASNVYSKKKEVSLFDDEEEDDLFSNRSSEPKAKPQISSSTSSRTSLGANRSEPEDDDLFSSSSLFSESKTKLSHSLFKDDLFSDESEDLFSKVDNKKQKNEKSTAVSQSLGDNLFSDQEPLDRDQEAISKVPSQNPKTQNVNTNIFGDGDDLFGNVRKPKGDDLFGEAPSAIKPTNSSLISKQQTKVQASNTFKKDLFNESDNDNDDLFSTSSKISKTNENPVIHQDSLFGNKNTSSLKIVKQELVENDLFGAKGVSSDIKHQIVKGKPPVLKPKKGLEKRSLFDSDSDDDLFSSPQGSLSSRKSVQSASAPTEPSEKEDKKKSSKDLTTSRLTKTDFSSIFSNDQDETTDFLLEKETDNSSNIFGEDADLFSSSNVNIKTPDLFNKLSSKPLVGPKEDSNRVSKENRNEIKTKSENTKSETLIETLNKQITGTSQNTPVLSVPVKTDMFSDIPPESEEKLPVIKKPEPPKSLNIKPFVETLKDNQQESNSKKITEDVQKPPVSKKPSPKVLVENPGPTDATDGEVISPPTPSKSVPGKLKATQLININTAALLPGARPSKSDPQLSSSSEIRVKPEQRASPPDPTPIPIPSQTSVTHQNASDILPKSSLLQSVNKERVKIQGKRRPSSRRARQEALRASSLDTGIDIGTEADNERSSVPPVTSTLMSPSTDEEDLFGVPPLDVVYDVKAVSPSTDIFGTPTVLSPVTNKELPSLFVSTPFVHSQPPPLDEEQEEGSNQEEDLFGSQSNLLGSLTKVKKPSEVVKDIQSKKGISAEDIFSDVEDDELFQGIREAPPPLVDDDDDDVEEYDELFMTRKKKDSTSSKLSHSGSVIATLDLFPKEDTPLSRPPHSTVSASSFDSSVQPKRQGFEDDSLFSSKDSIIPNSNSLFTTLEEPKELISDESLFKKSTKHSTDVTEDSLFPLDSSSNKPSDSSLGISGQVREMNKDSLLSHSGKEEDSSLLAKPRKVSSELFSSSDEISSRTIPDKPETKSEDSLFSYSGEEKDPPLFAKTSKMSSSELFSTSDEISSETMPDKPENKSKDSLLSYSDNDEDSSVFAKPSKVTSSELFSTSDEISSRTMSDKPETKSKDSLFSYSGKEEDSSLFAKPSKVLSSGLFPTSDEISSRTMPDKLETKSKEDESMASDEDLFGSHFNPRKVKSGSSVTLVADKSKHAVKTEEERLTKKEVLFGEVEEEEDVGNIFSSVSNKKLKVNRSVKSSLFGDEDDDDDIFGSLSSSKITESKTAPSACETSKGVSTKAMKIGSSGSSKPVKLETKQTFSDPLLSHGDQE